MPRHALLAAAVASTALALGACGGGDDGDDGDVRTETVTIDVARTSGNHAAATATGSVDAPVSISLRVSAAPKQRVAVVWGLACARRGDLSKRPETSGRYTTVPPDVRTLKLPAKDVALCAASASGRLARSGRVKVTLLSERRR